MKRFWLRYGPPLSIFILVVLYGVGIGGILSDHRAWFLSLTPLTLLISCTLMLLNHWHWSVLFALVLLVTWSVGYGIEVAGVHTGMIFGEYAYGATLGWKWLDVPLMIGVNWLLLVYSTGVVVGRLRMPRLVRAGIAAALMTLLDLLIEPVAIAYDFWHWKDGVPPLQNYIAWLVVAFSLAALFQYIHFFKRNRVAVVLLVLQFVFFGILNLLISWE
jgi:putative membrane protein